MILSKLTKIKYLFLIVIILLQLSSAKIYAQNFSSYVWTEYQPVDPSQVPADLKQMLTDHINEMIQDRDGDGQYDHLAPMYVSRGISSEVNDLTWGPRSEMYPGEWIFVNPGELVYSLVLAYPYLDAPTQNKVRGYLTTEMQGHPPIRTPGAWEGDWGWGQNIYDNYLSKGVRRELHEIPTTGYNVWPPLSPPIENCYALWLYAKNIGDWGYVANNWDSVVTAYDTFKNSGRLPADYTYAEIGGLIGMARLAQHEGQQTLANEAADLAIQGMQAGVDFDSFRQKIDNLIESKDPHNDDVPVFYSLVPEVGKYLRDNALTAVETYVKDETSKVQKQQWWQTRVFRHGNEIGENEYFSPLVSWSIFLGKAHILGENQETLRNYLDIPWSVGDLYYIQKLVATIEAETAFAEGDVNRDGSVNKDDALMVLSNFGSNPANIVGYYDPVGDNKINGLDFGWVVIDWGK